MLTDQTVSLFFFHIVIIAEIVLFAFSFPVSCVLRQTVMKTCLQFLFVGNCHMLSVKNIVEASSMAL